MPPASILVAEDQTDIRDLLVMNLRSAGYTVEAVADGTAALSLGLITHSVAQSDHAALIEKLADGATAKEAVTTFARPAPPALLAEHRARIGTIFAASSVEAVLERLDRDGSDFAVQTARLIRTRSPESLKLTFRLLRNGKSLILNECLKMEYRVGSRRVMSADFREGVRAVCRIPLDG